MPLSFPVPEPNDWGKTQAAARGRLLYIGNDNDLFLVTLVSADGQSWQQATGPAGDTPDLSSYSAARTENRWFVAGFNSTPERVLYRSADIQGNGWERVMVSPFANAELGADAIHGTATGRLIAILGTSVATSDNAGDTWTQRAALPAPNTAGAVAGNSSRFVEINGEIFFLSPDNRVFRSIDEGVTFTASGPVFPTSGPVDGFAVSSGGLWYALRSGETDLRVSSNQGATWQYYADIWSPIPGSNSIVALAQGALGAVILRGDTSNTGLIEAYQYDEDWTLEYLDDSFGGDALDVRTGLHKTEGAWAFFGGFYSMPEWKVFSLSSDPSLGVPPTVLLATGQQISQRFGRANEASTPAPWRYLSRAPSMQRAPSNGWFGGGRWLFRDDDHRLVGTSDLLNYSSPANPYAPQVAPVTGVAFGNGRWYARFPNGLVADYARSTDGSTGSAWALLDVSIAPDAGWANGNLGVFETSTGALISRIRREQTFVSPFNRFVRSVDGGATWSFANMSTAADASGGLARASISEYQGRLLWSAENSAAWFSEDDGVSWSRVPTPPPYTASSSVAYKNALVVWCIDGAQPQFSINNGGAWAPVPGAATEARRNYARMAENGRVFLLQLATEPFGWPSEAGYGIRVLYTDDGTAWTQIPTDQFAPYVVTGSRPPSVDNVLFLDIGDSALSVGANDLVLMARRDEQGDDREPDLFAAFDLSGLPPPVVGESSQVQAVGTVFDAQFGQATLRLFVQAAALPPTAQIPAPFRVFPQTGRSTGRAPQTLFGEPWGVQPLLIGQRWTVMARGRSVAEIGLPTAIGGLVRQATGLAITQFGVGLARVLQRAAGASSVAWGTAVVVSRVRAVGARSVSWGAGRLALGHVAASVRAGVRFGRRAVARSAVRPHRSFGWRSVWIGHPRGRRIVGYRAEGAGQSAVGVAQALVRFRALHLPPEGRFGQARVTRTPSC